MNYKPHYVLKNIVDLEHNVVEMFFGAGIKHYQEMIKYSESNPLEMNKKEHDIFHKHLVTQLVHLEALQKTATVKKDGEKLIFSFETPIPQNHSQLTRDGKNMLMRDFLDQVTKACQTGLVEIKHEGPWTIATRDDYIRLEKAIDKAMEHAYKVKSAQFWVEGEGPQ